MGDFGLNKNKFGYDVEFYFYRVGVIFVVKRCKVMRGRVYIIER